MLKTSGMRMKLLSKGIFLSLIIALAAKFLSDHYSVPVMLFALLIGMAFNFMIKENNCEAGVNFSSNALLRLGVGLLGFRLSFESIDGVGLNFLLAIIFLVTFTLLSGVALSFLFGRRLAFGVLAGGAVAICGASAAIAIASVLPFKKEREQDVILVIIGVTLLSTIAMIFYPILFVSLGVNNLEAGFLIGATIHDVAQVVGAGYSISDEVGIIATFIKMIRVLLLPVVLIFVMLNFRGSQTQKISLPWFVVLFVISALASNILTIPDWITTGLNIISSWLLVIAISAIGVKTSLSSVTKVSPSYLIIIVIETILLLICSLAVIFVFRVLGI